MGFLDDTLLNLILTHPILSLLVVTTTLLLCTTLYNLRLHPLSAVPGPLLAKISPLWLYYHTYIGNEASSLHSLHLLHGSILRISPSEISINTPSLINLIYISRGGFPKAPCYTNFSIDSHATIFSTLSNEYRSPRAKAVLPLFSTKNIRENERAIYGCVDRMVSRLKAERGKGGAVNILNLTRSLALDIVSTHLFHQNYNGTSESGPQLSASAFVDSFVGVGRFFYLPAPVFKCLEWVTERVFKDEKTERSMQVVDQFVKEVVDGCEGTENYADRLIGVGIGREEVMAQCKDLMFAGTDSTGMNLATIFRQLVLNPEVYQKLSAELKRNASLPEDKKQDITSLPYLSSIIKESLRISMANPTRLPRVVPPPGLSVPFEQYFIPAGTIVGCQAYSLHFNAEVFEDPFEFRPGRWLDSSSSLSPSSEIENGIGGGGEGEKMKEVKANKEEMEKSFFAWGAGSRSCIARNLAMMELYMGTERVVLSGVLEGARVGEGEEKVEILEWFNSRVVGERVELIWEGGGKDGMERS